LISFDALPAIESFDRTNIG